MPFSCGASKLYQVSRNILLQRKVLAAVSAVEVMLVGQIFQVENRPFCTKILSQSYSSLAGARIAWWQAQLIPYSYVVEFIPGNQLAVLMLCHASL